MAGHALFDVPRYHGVVMVVAMLMLRGGSFTSSFTLSPSPRSSSHHPTQVDHAAGATMVVVSPRFMLVDPSVIPMDLGIAVLSAAAGAASQVPRIQELEKELDETKVSLADAERQLQATMTELQDKLFTMDKVYEAQTERFKKQYDARMKEELERKLAKMKIDFKYNLDIKLEEQKSKMLANQLVMIAKGGVPKQEEIMNLRLNRERIAKANEQLETALRESQEELARLQVAAAAKKRTSWWWPF